MLRGRGVLGFLASWSLGFLVCWFLGLLVSRFPGFKVPEFQSFKVSTISCYQISISCFLEDIDLIFKIFKISLDGSAGFSGSRLFQNWQNMGFRFLRFRK